MIVRSHAGRGSRRVRCAYVIEPLETSMRASISVSMGIYARNVTFRRPQFDSKALWTARTLHYHYCKSNGNSVSDVSRHDSVM